MYKVSMMAHNFNPNTWEAEAEAGRSLVSSRPASPGHPRLCKEPASQKKKKSVSHMSSVNQTFVSRTPVKGLLGDKVIPSLEQGCKVCLEFLVRLDRKD